MPRDPRGRKPKLLLHPCPACGADIGAYCVRSTGKPSTEGCSERRALAGLPVRDRGAVARARIADLEAQVQALRDDLAAERDRSALIARALAEAAGARTLARITLDGGGDAVAALQKIASRGDAWPTP